MNAKTVLLLSTVMIFTSCGNVKLVSEKITGPSKVESDIVYYLPKTVLQLDIKVSSTTKKITENGVSRIEATAYNIKSIDITPILVNNPDECYRLKTDKKKFFFEENSSLTFNKYGVVQSLSSELNDKRPEMVEGALKGVASIAKIFFTPSVLGFVEEVTTEDIIDAKEIAGLRVKIALAQKALIKAVDEMNAKEIKSRKGQLVEYYSILKSYYENNRTEIDEKELNYSFTVYAKEEADDIPLAEWTGLKDMPSINISLNKVYPSENRALETATDTATIEAGMHDGLVYLLPGVGELIISTGSGESSRVLLQKSITIAQFGKKALLPITSKLFTKKKTILTFDPASGSISQLSVESNSSGAEIGNSLSATAETLRTTINDLKYNVTIENLKKEKELKELKESFETKSPGQKELLSNELEILRLQTEIEKLRKEIAESKN